jgi:hypothetical protein
VRLHPFLQKTTPSTEDRQVNKLVFKIRSEGLYSSFNFPLKLRPQEDELLSSWLVRLALLHRTMPMTFTNLYLPETKNKFWSADIDLQGDPAMLAALSRKSGVPAESLQAMTLRSYEGFLFEEIHGRTGGTQFINPLGMRGRRSTLPGLRYCPECLREDKRPYFRKGWRLAFSVLCPMHRCYLLDKCPGCATPLTPYLSCRGGKIEACYKCNGSLSVGKAPSINDASKVLGAVEWVYSVLNDGFTLIGGAPVQSHLYFRVLHHILRLIMSKRYGQRLRDGVGMEPLDILGYKTFESVPIVGQARMLPYAVWMLNEWPQRFIDICERQKLFSSALLKDLEQAPFWFWRIVVECLYNPDTVVTTEEIQEAAKFMKNQGTSVSDASLSRILGVRQLFRKRSMKLEDLL